MSQEIKIKASYVVDSCMFESDGYTLNKNYQDARLLVFEDNKLIVSEELQHILFKTYKELKNYEVISWTTDWHVSGNEDIKTLIVFVKKVSA